MQEVVITLPWPDKRLHAHAKGHWRPKHAATSQARELACALCCKHKIAAGPKKIEYRFFVPDNRRRDEANLIQSCKPYIDGLCDGGVLVADHWQMLHTVGVSVEVDRVNPRVELIIESDDGKTPH